MENLKNAFEVNTKFLKNKPILILDDICTTGATFEAMIEEFNDCGINNIICFATASPTL